MSIFEMICELAKKKDSNGLNEILKREKIEIDAKNQERLCAVSILAENGENEAVEFLITEFNADVGLAAMGYARGGHVEKVEDLLSRKADINNAIVSLAATGYAYGGHVEKVEDLLSRKANIENAIFGYARGGHVEKVEDLLSRGADINNAIYGYLIAGNTSEVESLMKRPGADIALVIQKSAADVNINEVNYLLKQPGADMAWAVYCYAINGKVEQVNTLLDASRLKRSIQDNENKKVQDALRDRLEGKSMGCTRSFGFTLSADALLSKKEYEQMIDSALEGYSRGGYNHEVDKLFELAPEEINFVITAYARLGKKDQVDALLDKGGDIIAAISGSVESENKELLQHLVEHRGASIEYVLEMCHLFGHDKLVEALSAEKTQESIPKEVIESRSSLSLFGSTDSKTNSNSNSDSPENASNITPSNS